MLGVARRAVAHHVKGVSRNGRRHEPAERATPNDAVRRLAEIEDRPSPEGFLVTAVEARNDEARALGGLPQDGVPARANPRRALTLEPCMK